MQVLGVQQQTLWNVSLETPKYWNFPRRPIVSSMFLMSTMIPLERAKTTVSSPREHTESLGLMKIQQRGSCPFLAQDGPGESYVKVLCSLEMTQNSTPNQAQDTLGLGLSAMPACPSFQKASPPVWRGSLGHLATDPSHLLGSRLQEPPWVERGVAAS